METCKSVDDDYRFEHIITLRLLEGQVAHFLRDRVI
jgi:hypothetical protein